ncbi:ATP-binding protein [Halochromatium roseum]|uniref:ATP-binding protein n=1 Tax=Halochromatium roseum TaxID=391920 RepID=UPI001913D43F|nr:ATP-binding protein [Halochromatium roseum]
MKFRLDDQADAVTRLVEQIEMALMAEGVPMKIIYAVNLCVEELVLNSVNHGYGGAAAADVEVDIERQEQRLIIDISDGAAAFDPTTEAAEPDTDAEIDDRPIGGLGIHLVKRLTDEMSYRRLDGRNYVRLVKGFEPDAEAAE